MSLWVQENVSFSYNFLEFIPFGNIHEVLTGIKDPRFIYGHVAMLSIEIEIWYLWYFLYNKYFTQSLIYFIQILFSKIISLSWNYNLIMFLYKRNIWFILGNLILFYYWATLSQTSVQQILTKLFQRCFQRWNNIGSSTLH